jgi:hypothetical protein
VIGDRDDDFVRFVVDDVTRRREAEARFYARAGPPSFRNWACSSDELTEQEIEMLRWRRESNRVYAGRNPGDYSCI